MGTRAAIAMGLFLACCSVAFALDPSLSITQYAHTAWTTREGLKGNVRSIIQTSDGYLWLGTEFGLARFDGVRFVAWTPPGQRLPSTNIRSLLAARDGTLWVGTLEGLASWKEGKLNVYAELAGQNILTLLEDHDGTVWAGTFGTPYGKLCAIQRREVRCYGEDGRFGQWVYTVHEDSSGRLWVQTWGGLWRWNPGPPKHYSLLSPGSFESSQTVVEGDNAAGLTAISDGRITQLADEKISHYRLSTAGRPFTSLNLLRDRNGALWTGTLDRGLLRVYNGKSALFTQSDGLSGDRILSLFEDREGNIWAGTAQGLDCFREFAAPTISVKQGLSSPSLMTVLATRDKSLWMSTLNGLNRWKDGHVTIYHAGGAAAAGSAQRDMAASYRGEFQEPVTEITDPELPDDQAGSLFEDDRGRIWVSTPKGFVRFEGGRFRRLREVPAGWVNSITPDGKAGIWISYQDEGLVRVVNDKVVERIPWSKLGGNVIAASVLPDPERGGLWLGFFQGGLVYFKDGGVRTSYGKNEGLGGGWVMGLHLDRDGTLWVATEGGLSRVRDGRVRTLTRANGLPCDSVHWAIEDDASSFWLYMPCGLARVTRAELERWTSEPTRKIQFTVFDSSDGVSSHARLTGYTPRVSISPDGQVVRAFGRRERN